MTVERAREGAGERVQGDVGDGRWSGGGCGGSSAAVERRRVRGGSRSRWRGIAIEMEGDRDRVSMKFKNIHEFKKCP